jgi:DNA-binding response OmpR family regulator
MQKPISAPDEVAKLLQEAMDRGHLVVVRASPPPHVDPRTPLLLALNQIFQLSPAESRALVELMEHKQVSREAMHAAMAHDGNPTSQIKTIDVVVSRMRRKLVPHSIAIVTVHGLGFRLAEGAHDRIRKLLAKYDPGLVPENLEMDPE